MFNATLLIPMYVLTQYSNYYFLNLLKMTQWVLMFNKSKKKCSEVLKVYISAD